MLSGCDNPAVAEGFDRTWDGAFAWLWRRRGAVVVGLGLLYALGFNGRWRITPDSALYVSLGRSLVAGEGMLDGRGQANPSPAGLPWLLGWVGGPGPAAQGVMLACALAVLGLTFLVMRRVGGGGRRGAPFALAVTGGVAVSSLFYEQTLNLLTELPFAVGLMLLLLGHEGRRDRGWAAGLRAWGLIGLGFAVMAAFRSVAAVVAAAYVFSELWEAARNPSRRRWAWAVVVAGAGAGLLVWWLSPAVRDDLRLFVWHLRAIDVGRAAHNLWLLLTEHLVEVTLGLDTDAATGCVVSGGLIVGGFMLLWVRRFWGVLWLANLLQWVVFLPEGRYCLPLLPVLVVGLLRLVGMATQRLAASHRDRVQLGVLGVLLVGNLIGVGDAIREQRVGGGEQGFYTVYRDGKYTAVVPAARQVQAMELPADAVVGCPEGVVPDVLSALTQRRVVREGSPDVFNIDVWLESKDGGWRVRK